MRNGREVGIIPMDPADTVSMALVLALHARCFSIPGADEVSRPVGSSGWRDRELSQALSAPGGFGFFAGAEQEPAGESPSPVGFILCRMAGEDCEVLSFGVDPQIRGAGLGFRLLEAAVIGAKAL